MVNPLDTEAQQAKTADRLNRDVYLNADQLEAVQQMHLFKVRED
jgi:hypothetical protein